MFDPYVTSGLRARPQPLRGQSAIRRSKCGMTMIELMISVVILTLCCGMLTSTLTSTRLHRTTNQQKGVAAEAARGVLEDMHNCSFDQIFASYNDDPADDPGGPGTAPGKHFEVRGLTPSDTDQDGFVGEVIFSSATAALMENAEDAVLGMPRDLNGDMRIDEFDHAGDYLILPVRVVLRWKGRGAERTFEIHTMLALLERME